MARIKTVSVLINVYKRVNLLQKQIEAIESKSYRVKEIFIWNNYGGKKLPSKITSKYKCVIANYNFGVWARFAFALNIDSDFICLFDDDTVPGRRWIENCVITHKKFPGLLGTRGLRFLSNKSYYPFKSYGWDNPNNDTVEVNIVGHSWFFEKKLLNYFWSEQPPESFPKNSGEDIHFSYMLQKYHNIKTYVPPHPTHDPSLWGSSEKIGKKFGLDKNAISQQGDALSKFDIYFKYYIKNGFVTKINDSLIKENVFVFDFGLRRFKKFKSILKKSKFIFLLSKKIIDFLRKFNIHIT